MSIHIPADIAPTERATYIANIEKITHGTGRLMLFAGDQKVEHLNDDFYGEGIPAEDNNPEHLFQIASKGKIGAFASQLGMIARYGNDYPSISYIVKMNSKTHLVKTDQAESKSYQWLSLEQVMEFKRNSGLDVVGVGYTIYVGSENEAYMFSEAANLIYEAHQYGLVSVLWMYPRGKAVKHEKDPHIIAGAAGVGACLGADFVKVNYPDGDNPAEGLKEAVVAAGRTKLICAGGSTKDPRSFFQELHDQIHIGGAVGNATGRNIHQRPLNEAVAFCNATFGITVENKSVEEALQMYNSQLHTS